MHVVLWGELCDWMVYTSLYLFPLSGLEGDS